MARTDNLNNYLTDIATAIKTKKGDSTPINASNFDTEISNLSSSVDAKKYLKMVEMQTATTTDFNNLSSILESVNNVLLNTFCGNTNLTDTTFLNNAIIDGSTSYYFYGCANITSVPQLDYTNCTSSSYMFGGCTNITSTGNVISPNNSTFTQMFYGCTSLTNIGTLSSNTQTLTNNMFEGCTSLVSVPNTLSFPKSTSCNSMFKSCTNLVNVPVFEICTEATRTTNYGGMFQECPNLSDESLDNILIMMYNITTNGYGVQGGKDFARLFSSGYGYNTRIQNCSKYNDLINLGWTNSLTS